MNHNNHPSKRRRIQTETAACEVGSSQVEKQDCNDSLYKLIESKEWSEVAVRAKQNPLEVSSCTQEPSMLALCCRLGAPYYCVKEIIDASPAQLRVVVDARGTALHEAIVCDQIGPKVIEYLLRVDERLQKIQVSEETKSELKLELEPEQSSPSSTQHHQQQQQKPLRATLLQDVDGYTPLHLLIRRRFQSHVLSANESGRNSGQESSNNNNNEDEEAAAPKSNTSNHFIEILELLVASCPEATIIPDRGEYEEPPIVMAIKANVYAPMLPQMQQVLLADVNNNNNNNNNANPGASETGGENIASAVPPAARIERHIYDMVNCMIQHYPEAACRVFNGHRGQYTALHSAVFHGRCSNTIELLLNAEKKSTQSTAAAKNQVVLQQQNACLLGNTQGELPLHFCAMRGEPPRTVALLAKMGPEAILKRDTSGLTPVHWLWIRFISTLLTIEDGRGSSITVPLRKSSSHQKITFSSLQQDNFDADLLLLRKIDPTVDFLRMRHIPTEVQDASDALQWAERTASLLRNVRDRLESIDTTKENHNNTNEEGPISKSVNRDSDNKNQDALVVVLTRLEAVTVLFWIKIVSLLKAVSCNDPFLCNDQSLVTTAFESECCPPLVARIIALVFPQQFLQPDTKGRFALHYAALRPWHAWEWPREDGTNDNVASSKLLNLESASLLRNAISLSPVEVAKHKDNFGCLPIHYMISTCIQACCATGRSRSMEPLGEMIEITGFFVKLNPNSLTIQDPRTQLLPFLQATAEATKHAMTNSSINAGSSTSANEESPLSIVYLLLRQDPSLIQPA